MDPTEHPVPPELSARLDEVAAQLGDTPNMTRLQAGHLASLMVGHGLRDVLELGFAHGAGTSYLAAIARHQGGSVTSVDRPDSRDRRPDAETSLRRTGAGPEVRLVRDAAGYNWALKSMLEDGQGERFDLCYLDGAHDWANDGLAFFLVDRLLRPGGWIVFDDVSWTFATSSVRDEDWVRAMTREEQTQAQVRKVWELLVLTHPNYGSFVEESDWAMARKGDGASSAETRRVIVRPSLRSLYHELVSGATALRRRSRSSR
jgi:predicted O-methyltransferase YrrM